MKIAKCTLKFMLSLILLSSVRDITVSPALFYLPLPNLALPDFTVLYVILLLLKLILANHALP